MKENLKIFVSLLVVLKNGSCRFNNRGKYTFDESNLDKDWGFLSFK